MMKQIATFCLVTVFLQPAAWAHETSPADDLEVPAAEGVDAEAVDVHKPVARSEQSSALEGFYAGGAVGPVFFRDNSIGATEIDYKTGSQIAGFGGFRYSLLRAEIEIASQGAEFEPTGSRFDGDFSIFRATANLYLDTVSLDFGWVNGVTPYLGGGVGIAVADIEGFDDDDTGFTAQGEVGVSVPVHRNIDVVPAYRFEWTDFNEFDKNQKAHTIRVGARYNF